MSLVGTPGEPALVFERLVLAHEREVRRVCRALLRDDATALDAAQEAFLRLWRSLAARRPVAEPRAWLRRAALSAAIDARRRSAARPEVTDVDAHEPATGEPGGAETLARTELRERYEEALAGLPDGQRTVFLLRHEAGLPLAEVARLLALEPSSVKTQFARACIKLQGALRPFAPDRYTGDAR